MNPDVCFNFLNDSCKNGDDCSRVHQIVRVPNGFCPDYAKRSGACSGEQQCGLTHGTWPIIIEAINSGTEPKRPHTVAVTEEAHPSKGRDRSQRSGKGAKGGRSHGGHGETPVGRRRGNRKGEGSAKRLRSTTPGSKDGSGTICTRCKNPGHTHKQCYATYDADGEVITSEKSVEVPEASRNRSKARKGQAYVAEVQEDPGSNEGFFYKGPVGNRGHAYAISGEAAPSPKKEEKGLDPTPLRGSAFQFIPACFRSLWFLILCVGMIPATMSTVAKDQKDLLWKGVHTGKINVHKSRFRIALVSICNIGIIT